MPLSDRTKALVGAVLGLLFGLWAAWRNDHQIAPSELQDILVVFVPPVLAYFGIYLAPNKPKVDS